MAESVEPTARERAEVSMRERAALLIAIVCTLVIVAALLIPKVSEMCAGLSTAAAR